MLTMPKVTKMMYGFLQAYSLVLSCGNLDCDIDRTKCMVSTSV